MRKFVMLGLFAVLLLAACVPADEAGALITGRPITVYKAPT